MTPYQPQQPPTGLQHAPYNLELPFGDTTLTKVFVGGLAWETRSDGLRRFFEPYGEILEAVVITDRASGRSRGYGFVTFRDSESARLACADPCPVIEGRRANCNLAYIGRLRPLFPLVPIRPLVPFNGVEAERGTYISNPSYQHSLSYGYPPAVLYPSYGQGTYRPDYLYQQNMFSPYTGQQLLQLYGVPGPLNAGLYPYGQPLSPSHAYAPSFVPGNHVLPFPRQNANAGTLQQSNSTETGRPLLQQQPFMSAHYQQYSKGNTSDQKDG